MKRALQHPPHDRRVPFFLPLPPLLSRPNLLTLSPAPTPYPDTSLAIRNSRPEKGISLRQLSRQLCLIKVVECKPFYSTHPPPPLLSPARVPGRHPSARPGSTRSLKGLFGPGLSCALLRFQSSSFAFPGYPLYPFASAQPHFWLSFSVCVFLSACLFFCLSLLGCRGVVKISPPSRFFFVKLCQFVLDARRPMTSSSPLSSSSANAWPMSSSSSSSMPPAGHKHLMLTNHR